MRKVAVIALIACTCSLASAAQMEVIPLMYLDANDFAASLRGGGSLSSDVLAQEATDFALGVMEDVSRRARGGTSMPDTLAYSRARAVPGGGGQDLSGLRPEGLSTLAAAPNQNALVVRGELRAIDELREVIAMLDVPTPMVNVDLLMDQLSTAASRRLDPHLRAWSWGGEASMGRLSDPVLGFSTNGLRGILGYDAGSTRRHTVTGANVTGMSGTPLVISAGEVRPRIAANVWYDPWGRRHVEYYPEAVFAGVTLWVLPTVHADDTVTMVLRPMLSEVAGAAPQIGAGDIIRRTLVETTVRVPDGQPLVIGGLDRRLDELSRDFPASQGTRRGDDSSIITVTPTIIRMRGTGG